MSSWPKCTWNPGFHCLVVVIDQLNPNKDVVCLLQNKNIKYIFSTPVFVVCFKRVSLNLFGLLSQLSSNQEQVYCQIKETVNIGLGILVGGVFAR